MPSNLGFTMSYKGLNGWIPLYPSTLQSQVLGWGLGESYGPYELTINANNWQNNQQILTLDGVSSEDILYCVKVLNGTQEQMIIQDEAYSLLDPYVGIESLNNQIKFTCTSTPTVDFTVQINWFR